ncbi:cyclic nucleotide-binding domain-containing protein [Haematococcus lacustris]|uniref:Cyclic nucleotide-binding domain-containing protein n=1 Tax=Haematococcus lacustris TaxID=44745 RepID=A0A699YN80_HAELA|nr:cyclic nucleotide-binding domain-containing protein [Haematococcus lacustris]
MDEDFRLEVCRLVEYLHCPEGFVLFEEGDKIDFCYVVLQGKVVFNKYNDKARRQDEIGTKSTGHYHLGT